MHLAHPGAGVAAVALQGVGQRHGDVSTLGTRQPVGRSIEVETRHGISAVNPAPHLDGIEINFHDALFAPDFLNQESEISLQAFSQPGTLLPQEHVAGRLLADGARAPLTLAFPSLKLSFLNLFQVKTAVFKEQIVLARHHRLRQVVGDPVQRHPVVIDLGAIAMQDRLDSADEHQRRDIDGYILKNHHRQNRRGEEENQYVAQPATNFFHSSLQFITKHYSAIFKPSLEHCIQDKAP